MASAMVHRPAGGAASSGAGDWPCPRRTSPDRAQAQGEGQGHAFYLTPGQVAQDAGRTPSPTYHRQHLLRQPARPIPRPHQLVPRAHQPQQYHQQNDHNGRHHREVQQTDSGPTNPRISSTSFLLPEAVEEEQANTATTGAERQQQQQQQSTLAGRRELSGIGELPEEWIPGEALAQQPSVHHQPAAGSPAMSPHVALEPAGDISSSVFARPSSREESGGNLAGGISEVSSTAEGEQVSPATPMAGVVLPAVRPWEAAGSGEQDEAPQGTMMMMMGGVPHLDLAASLEVSSLAGPPSTPSLTHPPPPPGPGPAVPRLPLNQVLLAAASHQGPGPGSRGESHTSTSGSHAAAAGGGGTREPVRCLSTRFAPEALAQGVGSGRLLPSASSTPAPAGIVRPSSAGYTRHTPGSPVLMSERRAGGSRRGTLPGNGSGGLKPQASVGSVGSHMTGTARGARQDSGHLSQRRRRGPSPRSR
jgi:hypothetical protein